MNIKSIYDNGGASFDRYTIVFDDNSVYGMSHNAASPQGFCQYIGKAEEFDFDDSVLGVEIDNIPVAVARQIVHIICDK